MPIYSVQVYYSHKRFYFGGDGIHIDFASEEESEKRHACVEAKVEERLDFARYTWRHEYSWPDGSIFKWIETDIDMDRLRADLDALFKTIEHYVEVIVTVSDPKEYPYKFRRDKKTGKFEEVKTLEEYMSYAENFNNLHNPNSELHDYETIKTYPSLPVEDAYIGFDILMSEPEKSDSEKQIEIEKIINTTTFEIDEVEVPLTLKGPIKRS